MEPRDEGDKLKISYEIIEVPTSVTSEEHVYYYVDQPVV
jgi:hypothetical protein